MAEQQPLQLNAQQQADLAHLAFILGHHPKTRAGLAGLVKEIDPRRYSTSFRDVAEQEKFDAYRRDLEERLDVSGMRAAAAAHDAQKAKLAERYGEEQIAGIDAVRTRYGLKDWNAAATLYAAETGAGDPTLRPPRPDPVRDATWEFPTVEGRDGKPLDFKAFASDLRGSSLNAAYRAIDEIQNFKNRTLSPAFQR